VTEVRIDPLGEKADFYRALAVEQWGPVTRRTDVRLAVFIGVIGVVLVVAGGVSLVLMHDLNALVGGLFGVGYSVSVLWPFRERWRQWRDIGTVTLDLPDLILVPGDLTAGTVRIEPRRDLVLSDIALVFEYRDSRSGQSPSAWQVDAAIADAQLRAGTTAAFPVELMLPPGLPASRFDSAWTRQWSITVIVSFTDGRRWQRELPVLVWPTP
jgi:hypothetical protein